MPDDERSSTYKPPVLDLFGEEHIRQYRATDGEVGYEWNGATCLLLTTTGRKSGEPRTQPLIFSYYEDAYVVVASQGGAPTHPNWYFNLVSNPTVEVQVKGDRFPATARTAEGEERTKLWKLSTVTWPNYDEYTKRTDRVIPVVVLDRTSA
jgi:deazaflavin-dependent oxidoreductase (nitroreductase family)